LPRRRTGLNAQQQRKLSRTIKRARMLGLLPFGEKLVRK
ncbi:MAG: 30S ribosomal protein S18, partial [Deinococcus sp.]|nr:30S ribosomal protein S18 [Deinococcus sp.]